MGYSITDQSNSTHYHWGNQCSSWVLTDLPGLSVKQESMPGGTREQLHYHQQATQFFFILKGRASFFVEGRKEDLLPNQGILIQSGTAHYISNETGDDLDFLVISQPSAANDRINI